MKPSKRTMTGEVLLDNSPSRLYGVAISGADRSHSAGTYSCPAFLLHLKYPARRAREAQHTAPTGYNRLQRVYSRASM